MRHVFPTSEVFHLWAHQTQSDARNPSGNVFFEGATIYSYRRSWPLARIYKRKVKGALFVKDNPACNLVLLNSERASVTTAKHKTWANRAVSHLPSVCVPYVDIDARFATTAKENHARNLEHFADVIARELGKAQRAMQARTVEWRSKTAECAWLAAGNYIKFFGIRRKLAPFPTAGFAAAMARAQRIETPDPIRDAAKIRARAKAQARERVMLQARYTAYCEQAALYNAAVQAERAKFPPFDAVAHWRETGQWQGQRITLPDGAPSAPRFDYSERALRRKMDSLFDMPILEQTYDVHREQGVFLRVRGDQIETSQGARIPLEHAPRIWRLVQACRATGRAYAKNGHTEHAGPYAIDAVSAEGELRAGCHVIPYAELELLARTLGYIA